MQSFSTAREDEDDVDVEPQRQHRQPSPTTTLSWKDSVHKELPFDSKPLGSPLPFDEHACSVSLPTWCSVVGYEEGHQEVVSAMNCGYPRFVYHPYILQLMDVFVDEFGFKDGRKEDCLVLPTEHAALRCRSFLLEALREQSAAIGGVGRLPHSSTVDVALVERPEQESSEDIAGDSTSPIRAVSLPDADVYAVIFPAETGIGIEAKAYWQHTGEIVSSRRAEKALKLLNKKFDKRVTCCPVEGTPTIWHSSDESSSQSCSSSSSSTETNVDSDLSSSPAYDQLKDRIANWTKVDDKDNVFLTPSGMATIYKSLRSARRYQMEKYPGSMGGTSIVYGFPYLDTLKMCSRQEFSPAGVEFFGKGGDEDLKLLERTLNQSPDRRWSAIFTEVPSNPLLKCPDLDKLRQLADEYDFCLVVDDTIGNFLNVDLIQSGLADAVCTSLTKLVSGRGDAIAGSVVCNPNTEKGRWMKEDMARDTDLNGGLHESDAWAMVHNSKDFPERNARINETTELLADFLKDHSDVETVWYPKYVAPLFTKYQRTDLDVGGRDGNGGFGGLLSIHLHPHICQRTFYDKLDVAKGPSLGTNFTLVCPYTLLAHYHELDFAMNYDVPPNLIRIAVGLEDIDELKEKFAYALDTSRLHPKLT